LDENQWSKTFLHRIKNATQRREWGVPAGDTGVLSGNKNDFHNDFIRLKQLAEGEPSTLIETYRGL